LNINPVDSLVSAESALRSFEIGIRSFEIGNFESSARTLTVSALHEYTSRLTRSPAVIAVSFLSGVLLSQSKEGRGAGACVTICGQKTQKTTDMMQGLVAQSQASKKLVLKMVPCCIRNVTCFPTRSSNGTEAPKPTQGLSRLPVVRSMTPPPHEYMRGRTHELFAAIRSYDFWRRAEYLISSGMVDINQTDSTGATPLIYSACHGSARIVEMLLERGADLAAVNNFGLNALHASAIRGDPQLAVLLVEGGADVRTLEPVGGTSPLHLAAQYGTMKWSTCS